MSINYYLIKKKSNYKNFFRYVFKYFFYFFWIIGIFFLLDKSIKELNLHSIKTEIDFKIFFFIFFFFILIHNIYSYRFFFFLKKITKYPSNYTNWSILYFQTGLMNCFLDGSGHLFRAIKLKKRNVNYDQFISINYIFYMLIFLINFLLFLFFSYFITGKKNILLCLVIVLVPTFILINKQFYGFLLLFFKKKLKFVKKKYKYVVVNLIFYCKSFFSLKKNVLIFSFFTLVIFFLELINFYFLASNFIAIENIFLILLIFITIFFLNKVPYLANIIGLNEIILGIVVENLGFQFAQGSLIQFIYRIFFYISILFNNILYYFINFNKKS
jgi:hypothetical protein